MTEFAFPKAELSELGQHGPPTYEEAIRFNIELRENAAAIHTTFGNGDMGMLHHVLTPGEYVLQSAGVPYVEPIWPADVPDQVNDPTAAQRANHMEQVRRYDINAAKFQTNVKARVALKAQVIAAIKGVYLDTLYDPIDGHGNVTTQEIRQMILTEYGTVTPDIKARNMTMAAGPIDLNKPIEVYIKQMSTCQSIARAAGDPITNATAIMFATAALKATGRFKADLHTRSSAFDPAAPAETWAQFVTWLKKQDKLRREEATTDEAGFHGQAHAATIDDKSKDDESIDDKIARAIAFAFAAERASSPTSVILSTAANKTGPKKYCWSHGNCGHTSAECKNRKTGHKEAATKDNQMNGTKGNIVHHNMKART